ncbi:TonB-dependent receptor domain-containing protein [Gemmatimonadota bacterium]
MLLILAASPAVAQQSGSVSGTVVDDQGNPIVNARVLLPASGITVITDAAGEFRLMGLPETGSVTIRITTLGFSPVTETVEIGAAGLLFELRRTAISLDALVVTGTAAGVQEARAVGNSVVSIGAADLTESTYVPDVSSMINARAPGVFVTPGTGQVGAGPTIRFRGASSFSLNTQPLIYVDGIRLDNSVASGIAVQGISGVVNRLNDLNPEDIESIEIIKGPAAATLYGTEASNGVIQILTKKGRAGPPEISVRLQQGVNWFANAADRIPKNWGFDPALLPDDSVPYEMDLFALEKERGNPPIFRTGQLQGYGASIKGGSDLVTYFAGMNYDRDEGIEPSNKLWRVNSRANVLIAPNPAYRVALNVGYAQGRVDLAREGTLGRMVAVVAAQPSLRDNPDFRGFLFYPPEIPRLAESLWQDFERGQYSLTIEQRPRDWFMQRLTVGQDQVRESNIDLVERLDDSFEPYFAPTFRAGSKYREDRDVTTTTLDYSITVSTRLANPIRSSTTFGAQYYRRYTDRRVMEGETFPAPGLRVVDALATRNAGESFVENKTLGLFVQQQIALRDRVFLTGALRGDDNSAFGRDYDFVIYPKASATWVLSEESFWNVGLIDALKLRFAYGQAGQQPGAFDATRSYSAVTGAGGVAALTPTVIGNDSLGPERGTELELGFEAGLWQSRVGADFSFYYSRTSDAILLRQPPPSFGYPSQQYVNAGQIRNRGFELAINALAVQSRNVEVELTMNLGTNSNKVLDLGGVDQGSGFIAVGLQNSNRHVPGYPVGSYFNRKIVDAQLTGTGPTAVVTDVLCDGGDPNGILLADGTPTEPGGPAVACEDAPYLYLGNPIPTFEGAFSATLTLFKNLQLYALLDWQTGHTLFDANFAIRCQFMNLCRENYFPEEYDPVLIAGLHADTPWQAYGHVDASFAKIRELSLTWTLPDNLASLMHAKRASITAAGRNLHTFTGYGGMDPQGAFVGFEHDRAEQANTPQLAALVTTIRVTF